MGGLGKAVMTDSEQQFDVPAHPAATLVLFRDRAGRPPELLLVERSAKMAFAGGAIVFPGGRVDPDDHLIAARFDAVEPDCAAARVAAIRETIEESGIPIGVVEGLPNGWLASARVALNNREPFSKLLDAAQLTLDLDQLVPFARWRPNFRETRVFDTRFYIARAPDDLPEAEVDATENVRTFWGSAQDTIEAAERGDVHVIFPTHRNLERLALFGDFDEARAHAESIPVRMVTPWIESEGEDKFLCIPEDMGYPVTRQSFSTAKRAGD
jgi:8-oxo-dGTP pyrophosphatase MutT (NUDIX family)